MNGQTTLKQVFRWSYAGISALEISVVEQVKQDFRWYEDKYMTFIRLVPGRAVQTESGVTGRTYDNKEGAINMKMDTTRLFALSHALRNLYEIATDLNVNPDKDKYSHLVKSIKERNNQIIFVAINDASKSSFSQSTSKKSLVATFRSQKDKYGNESLVYPLEPILIASETGKQSVIFAFDSNYIARAIADVIEEAARLQLRLETEFKRNSQFSSTSTPRTKVIPAEPQPATNMFAPTGEGSIPTQNQETDDEEIKLPFE